MKYVSRVSSEIVLHEHCDKRCHVGRFAHGAAFHETWCRMQQLLAIEFAGCEESSRASVAQKIKAAAAATSAASVRPCDDSVGTLIARAQQLRWLCSRAGRRVEQVA